MPPKPVKGEKIPDSLLARPAREIVLRFLPEDIQRMIVEYIGGPPTVKGVSKKEAFRRFRSNETPTARMSFGNVLNRLPQELVNEINFFLPNLPQVRQIIGPVCIETDPDSLDVTDVAFNEDWTNRRNTLVAPTYPSRFAETYASVGRDPRLDEVRQRYRALSEQVRALVHTIQTNSNANIVEQAQTALDSINEELEELQLSLQRFTGSGKPKIQLKGYKIMPPKPVKAKKIPDSLLPGTRYKINLNLHGGGWKDTFDLRDKIRRLRLRLRANDNNAPADIENIDNLIKIIETDIKNQEDNISYFQSEKEHINRQIEDQQRKLILYKGRLSRHVNLRSQESMVTYIKTLKRRHDKQKELRDKAYIKRKELKKLLEEVKMIKKNKLPYRRIKIS